MKTIRVEYTITKNELTKEEEKYGKEASEYTCKKIKTRSSSNG